MIRIVTAATTAVLGLAFMASAANAADIVVSTAGKSPAEVRAAVEKAAHDVCALSRPNDVLSPYTPDTCVSDTIVYAMFKVPPTETAMNTRTPN